MNEKLRQLKYWWNCHTSGLEDFIEDVRDLHIRDLFGDSEAYKPKYTRRELAPVFEKDQLRKENCSFQAGSRALSIYSGDNISARCLTFLAWIYGYCAKNGSAQLRNWCKVAQKYGFLTEAEVPSDESLPWEEYININLSQVVKVNKIGSYWKVDTIDEYLQAIDKGYAVVLGIDWKTTYNRGGGFKDPWIITKEIRDKGLRTGGHAICSSGYDLDYMGYRVAICENSYSKRWGDNGRLYIDLDILENEMAKYGAYAITPIPYTPKEVKINLMTQALGLLSQLLDLLKKKK